MKVSVVIPAWNAETTLGETLESVLAQTATPDEIIVVDDGSSDGTAEVARRADGGVRVVWQPRSGPPAALNHGIAASRGSLLCFVDADDLWTSDKLELQLETLRREPESDGVLGWMESFLCPAVDAAAARLLRVPEGRQEAWTACALLVRRQSLERVGPFAADLSHGYGIDWFDRARTSGIRLAIPDAIVLRRRIRPESFSRRDTSVNRVYLAMARRALERRRARRSGADPD